MIDIEKLKKQLECVPDSYSDFVEAGIDLAMESDENYQKLSSYINDNPSALSSDIIRFETEEILGIKPL